MNQIASGAASMDVAARDASEAHIKQYQNNVDNQLGFVRLLVHVAVTASPSSVFCSIVLKNTIKNCWNPSTSEHCVQEEDKAYLRETIIACMLQSPPSVQRNLAEAITIIADIDFPKVWPNALEGIVVTLAGDTTPTDVRSAALSTAHSILAKYRKVTEFSEDFVMQLRSIYSTVLMPLLKSMGVLLAIVEQANHPESAVACKGLVSAVECMADVTGLDLGDEFISNVDTVVDIFLRCLALQNPALAPTRDEGGVMVELKSAVTSCVTHFLNAFDEDFEKYAKRFLDVVWRMIAEPASATPAMDDLVIRGMELLRSACRGTTRSEFDKGEVVQSMVQQIVIPNLVLQDEDVEMYTTEPDAYIQRDIEGSDYHTRRRAAGELVRTLMTTVPDKARPLLTEEVNRLFAAAGGNWKAKDAGIFLASSLALEGQHADSQRGATQSLGTLIPFDTFFGGVVMPELASPATDASPQIIKADCIRVVATFRTHIDPSAFPTLLSVLPVWMESGDAVVLSYAAHALERLLTVEHNQISVVTETMITPHAAAILRSLCIRAQEGEQPNAYVAQCLMRMLQRVPGAVSPYIGDVVISMNEALGNAAKNPSNPLFSHCMFEVLSRSIALHPEKAPQIEQTVWANLMYVLVNNTAEYVPYVLQILAQLLRSYPASSTSPTPPAQYQGLLEPLTQSGMYEQRGNIPAIVCLLTAFIERYPQFVITSRLTEKVLNVFSYLVQLKNYDHEGLTVLTVMLLSYPSDVMGKYLNPAIKVLMQRLQAARTPKYVRILIIFFSVYVVMRGPADLIQRMGEIQPGLFLMFLGKVWLPNVQKIKGTLERKVCIVALAKLLCESAELQSNEEAWASSVFSCLKMIHTGAEHDDYASFAPTSPTLQDLVKQQQTQLSTPTDAIGFTNVFCPLSDAVPKPVDVCADVADPDAYFRSHMTQLLRGPGQGLVSVLQRNISSDLLALIQ